jgi:hypothetical protein
MWSPLVIVAIHGVRVLVVLAVRDAADLLALPPEGLDLSPGDQRLRIKVNVFLTLVQPFANF